MGCFQSTPSPDSKSDALATRPSPGDAANDDASPAVKPTSAHVSPTADAKSTPGASLRGTDTSNPAKQDYLHDTVKQRAANTLSKLRTDKHVQDVYSIKETIGTGGFSVVKLAVAKATKKQWACKIMNLPPVGAPVSEDESSREDIFKEIDLLCNVNHDNVLCLSEFFVEGDKVYIITELLTGGELLDAVLIRGSYSEAEARSCFAQLLSGINYLHERNIVHRDLKLENLLLARPDDISNIKIADFGLAKKMVGAGLQTVCGTPQYVAPEVIMGITNYEYGPGVDMWSAGVVLYVLLGGYPPFWSDSEPMLFDLIRRAAYSFDDPVWKTISDVAKDMIRKLLVVDPSARLSAAAALQHPWITSTEASFVPLMGTKDNMKRHFRPKFKAVVDAVIASNRMGNLMGKRKSSVDGQQSIGQSTEPIPRGGDHELAPVTERDDFTTDASVKASSSSAAAGASPGTMEGAAAGAQGTESATAAGPAAATAAGWSPGEATAAAANATTPSGRPSMEVTTGDLLAAAVIMAAPRSGRSSEDSRGEPRASSGAAVTGVGGVGVGAMPQVAEASPDVASSTGGRSTANTPSSVAPGGLLTAPPGSTAAHTTSSSAGGGGGLTSPVPTAELTSLPLSTSDGAAHRGVVSGGGGGLAVPASAALFPPIVVAAAVVSDAGEVTGADVAVARGPFDGVTDSGTAAASGVSADDIKLENAAAYVAAGASV